MRHSRTAIITIFAVSICLICAGLSSASVVTVDVACKSISSDVATLDVAKGLKIQGDQVGLLARSTVIEPQIFTLKINGLASQGYDVYVNRAFKWTKTAKDFEAGVEFRVDGRIVDSALIRCLEAVKEPIKKASDKLSSSSDPEARRVSHTLGEAAGWARLSTARDQTWRSVTIIVAPTGRTLQSMKWATRNTDVETVTAVTNACWYLQQARDRMYHVIKDPVLRNEAVIAMTPLEFTAVYSTKNGKPHIDARLLNNCNLPISGYISMALPPGWKSTAKKLKFSKLKSGEVFSLAFDLVAPSKTAVAPGGIPMAANITVVQDTFRASMKLTTTAKATPK